MSIEIISQTSRNKLNSISDDYNKYFEQLAYKDHLERKTTVYVATTEEEVVGFVTASMNKLYFTPSENSPKISFPALLLGKIAASKKGIGKLLVGKVLLLAEQLAEVVGCRVVFLHVEYKYDQLTNTKIKNTKLIEYYNKLGFEFLKDDEKKHGCTGI